MMNAPSNPAMGQNWVWDGSRWVCCAAVGTVVIAKVFHESGPYMPSPGLQSLIVEAVAGGGGGGGAIASWQGGVTLGWVTGGGGGQAGGYSRKTLAAPLVLGGVNVTIGVGGVGGVGAAPGQPGTDTSFGALCLAKGGAGGNGSNVGSGNTMLGQGGALALPGVGDLARRGNAGQPGSAFYLDPGLSGGTCAGGAGGGSLWGGSTQATVMFAPNGSMTGASAADGAGGAGGAAAQVSSPATGGQGGQGLVVVTEFCWADGSDVGCGCPPGGARVAREGPPQDWGHFDAD